MTVQSQKFCLIYITCADHDEAERIARISVQRRLAACANIFPPHTSIYEWDGQVQKSFEIAMILKTSADCVNALKAVLKENHSYDNPCVVVLDITDGSEKFLNWIKNQLCDGVF